MKKLSLLLACMLAATTLVTGCGTPANTESKGEDPAPTTSEEVASEGEAEGKSDETITLLSWNNEQLMKPYLDGFEAETGIKIDLQFVPPVQQYVDKFMVLASSKQVTDMFYTAAENKQEIIEKGLAEDLSALPIFERINENKAATYGADGKIYAYAPEAWVGGIFYNMDLFEQAGIAGKPKTWSEYIDAMKKLKEIGVEPLVSGAEQVHEQAMTLYNSEVISQNPQADYEINEGKTTFADQYTKPFATWYKDMYETGLYSQISLGLNADQALDMFTTGQSAMYAGGPWNIPTINEKNPDLKYDMFGIPDEAGNVVLNGAVSPGLSISSSTDKKDAAWKFLEYMSTDENIKKWQKTTGNVLIVDGIDYEMDTIINQFKEDAIKGNFYLSQIAWNNSAGIYKELLAGVQDVMTGTDTIENVPARMDAKMAELSK